MKYGKKDIEDFKTIVCPKCRCYSDCISEEDKHFDACPKFFNFMLYHTEDGLYPIKLSYKNERQS